VDLSFHRFEPDAQVTALPPDLAVMLVGVGARQAASPTAMLHARLAPVVVAPWCAPPHGAFNLAMAQLLTLWKQE
jgi:hypothetical protein